jgi:hypothetical protein
LFAFLKSCQYSLEEIILSVLKCAKQFWQGMYTPVLKIHGLDFTTLLSSKGQFHPSQIVLEGWSA